MHLLPGWKSACVPPSPPRRTLGPRLRAIMLLAGAAFTPVRAAEAPAAGAIPAGPGPHLFLDDFLIAEQSFLTRTVNRPIKLPDPILTGRKGGDDNFQPYLSVIRDPASGRYRVWYNTPESFEQSHLGYMESTDGIHWIRPHRVLKDPQRINFGASVLDRGPQFTPARERFVLAFWEGGGTKVAVSADGFDWRMLVPHAVWQHNHDITTLRWDPLRQQYLGVGTVKMPGPHWEGVRRIPHQSVSKDLLHWEEKWPIITPKTGASLEQGETEFYSMAGIIPRGPLLIGLVKILRDDLNATPGKNAAGMGDLERKAAGLGYTVLAWTRDGRRWQRDDQPFLLNDPDPARWDHAMAWGDEQIIVGDETYIYYGGYQRGHKVGRYDERQIGLVRMPRDRYVAREADLNPGRLVTRPLVLQGRALHVNARIVGTLRVRLVDETGGAIDGYGWMALRGDSVRQPVNWAKRIDTLGGRRVRLEFELTDAQLFGFEIE